MATNPYGYVYGGASPRVAQQIVGLTLPKPQPYYPHSPGAAPLGAAAYVGAMTPPKPNTTAPSSATTTTTPPPPSTNQQQPAPPKLPNYQAVDYSSDPILQQALGSFTTQRSQLSGDLLEQQRRLLLGFGSGELASKVLGANAPDLQAIQNNPFSTLNQIQHSYETNLADVNAAQGRTTDIYNAQVGASTAEDERARAANAAALAQLGFNYDSQTAGINEAIQQATARFGLDTSQYGSEQGMLGASLAKRLSDLGFQENLDTRGFNEAENQRNLFYSSDRNQGLSDLATKYRLAREGETLSTNQALERLGNAYAQTKLGYEQGLQSQNRALGDLSMGRNLDTADLNRQLSDALARSAESRNLLGINQRYDLGQTERSQAELAYQNLLGKYSAGQDIESQLAQLGSSYRSALSGIDANQYTAESDAYQRAINDAYQSYYAALAGAGAGGSTDSPAPPSPNPSLPPPAGAAENAAASYQTPGPTGLPFPIPVVPGGAYTMTTQGPQLTEISPTPLLPQPMAPAPSPAQMVDPLAALMLAAKTRKNVMV